MVWPSFHALSAALICVCLTDMKYLLCNLFSSLCCLQGRSHCVSGPSFILTPYLEFKIKTQIDGSYFNMFPTEQSSSQMLTSLVVFAILGLEGCPVPCGCLLGVMLFVSGNMALLFLCVLWSFN